MAYRRIPENEARCYVYVIAVDGVVRYIGKGTGRRIDVHLGQARLVNARRESGEIVRARKLYNCLAKALKREAEIETRKIAEGLTHSGALDRERAEIAAAPSGSLWNVTAGGEGLDPKAARARWNDPAYRRKMQVLRNDPDFIAKVRANTVRQFSDPAQREAASQRSKARWNDPEYQARASQASRDKWNDPAVRENHREAIRRGWEENPDRRIRRAEITASYAGTPEFRQKTSERFRELWTDPEFRARATAQWSDPEKIAARAAKLTPEFLKRRGEAIRQGMARKKALREGGNG